MKLAENEKHNLKSKYKMIKESRQRDKIRTILMVDRGYSRTVISEVLLIDEKTVTKWQTEYLENSILEDFLKSNHVPYAGKLTEEEKKS
jgi:hypothetical protein